MIVEPYERVRHLEDLQALMNRHLETVIPGLALPAQYIARRLRRNPDQLITDPWVAERVTLCALEGGIVRGAAHLLRYGASEAVGQDYRAQGVIAWALHALNRPQAGTAVIGEARRRMAAWGVRGELVHFDLGVPVLSGVPDSWPHVAAALQACGFEPDGDASGLEQVRGGVLPPAVAHGDAPLPGLDLVRDMGRVGARFRALHRGEEVGYCDCRSDLSQGGRIPALAGWAEIADLQVEEAWRGRGIGTWLLRHCVGWLRLARCDRVLLAVATDGEGQRAAHLYDRWGWGVFTGVRTMWVARP